LGFPSPWSDFASNLNGLALTIAALPQKKPASLTGVWQDSS
jgi:hypothetical protein